MIGDPEIYEPYTCCRDTMKMDMGSDGEDWDLATKGLNLYKVFKVSMVFKCSMIFKVFKVLRTIMLNDMRTGR